MGNTVMACIAVVEDEDSLRADLVEYLEASGHRAWGCDGGPALDRVLAQAPVEIVVLDVNLPGESGFAIASRLRERAAVGIIMLTACGLSVDRVVGLELGADVYMVKPVELRELEAQVRALARRLRLPAEDAPPPAAPARASAWVYDRLAWTLNSPDGVAVKLTGNERVFVSLLVARPGEPVTRADIYAALGKRQWDPLDRSVDSMVRRLRAKCEEAMGGPIPIEAVHGTGYAFTAPVAAKG